MTVAIVPTRPRLPSTSGITVGAPVRGLTWRTTGDLINYLLGCGATLVPIYAPLTTLGNAETQTYYFRVFPQYQNLTRLWLFSAHSTSKISGTTVDFAAPSGGTARTYATTGSTAAESNPLIYLENVSSQTASNAEATCTITNNSATNHTIDSLGCFALPRERLAQDANEHGIDLGSLAPGLRIYDGTGLSYGWLADGANALEATVRRCALFSWAVPEDEARTVSSGTPTAIFQGSPIVLARKLRRAALSGSGAATATVYARCKTDAAGTTGTVRITSQNGNTVDIAIPINSTSYAWFSGTVNVHAEDLTHAKGLRSSTWDTLTAQFFTGGSGTLSLMSLCIGEA